MSVHTADLIRWLAIFACVFNFGIMVAFYQVVGRLFIPTWPLRLILIGYVFMLITVAGYITDRFGMPATWMGIFALLALLLQAVGLVWLHRWYGTEEGRRHLIKMTR